MSVLETTICDDITTTPGRSVPLSRVRNIGIMAHINAGKTTLTERILYYTGVNTFMGEVHEGTATMDWMAEERERGITISSASTVCPWRDCQINIIDTPGHVDFTGEVERSLRVLDGAIAVFCAVRGVQPQSETVWRQARQNGIPAIAFINKMDRTGADPRQTVVEIEQRLAITPLPVQLPVGVEDAFEGVIDLLTMEFVTFSGRHGGQVTRASIPDALVADAALARSHLVECLAEYDDTILNRFLGDDEPSLLELMAAIRKATAAQKIMPVFYGSAHENKGVQPLLDGAVGFLPSPQDVWEVTGITPGTGELVTRNVGDGEPFSALAFKTLDDRRLGQLAFFRVYSGTAREGLVVRNSRTGELETLGKIVQVRANLCEPRDTVFSGDIAAVVGLGNTVTGDTLCDPAAPIHLAPMMFPEPVVSVRVEARSIEQQAVLRAALARLAQEDPTLVVSVDADTGQSVLAGMGELHMEVIRDRLEREFKIAPSFGQPRVNYRETITKRAEVSQTFAKILSNGEEQTALMDLAVSPGERGSGVIIVFGASVKGIPECSRTQIESALRETGEVGTEHGCALTDLVVVVEKVSWNGGGASEATLKYVAATALRKAAAQAGVRLLEPIMALEVNTPQEYMGEVIADLSSRRGRVTEVDTLRSENTRVMGQVPLGELFGYATALRSLTRGRADFVAEASHYERVPETL